MLLARTAPASPCSYRLSLEDLALMVSNWNMGSQAEPENRVETVSAESQAELMRDLEMFVQMRWNSTEGESAAKLIDWLSLESLGSASTFEVRNHDERAFRLHETRRSTIMKILGLRGLEERRVAELSNGESRRAVMARALLSRPKLLLLDAPFAGFDVDGRSRLMGMLNHLMTVGRVSFMITSTRLEDLPSSVTNVIELADDSYIKRIEPAIVAGEHAPTSRRRGLSGESSQGPVRLDSSGPLSEAYQWWKCTA